MLPGSLVQAEVEPMSAERMHLPEELLQFRQTLGIGSKGGMEFIIGGVEGQLIPSRKIEDRYCLLHRRINEPQFQPRAIEAGFFPDAMLAIFKIPGLAVPQITYVMHHNQVWVAGNLGQNSSENALGHVKSVGVPENEDPARRSKRGAEVEC